MIQWLGLQGKFPEPQTVLHSLGATCPAETQALLTTVTHASLFPVPQHITYSHSVP